MAYQSGEEAIGNGAITVPITFAPPFGVEPDVVLVAIQNEVDDPALSIRAQVSAKGTDGFTAELDGTTDSANYVLAWIAGDADLVFQAVTKLGTRITDLPSSQREPRTQDRVIMVQDGVTRQIPFGCFQSSFIGWTATPPVASSDEGIAGQVAFDADHAYLHTGSRWLRIPYGGDAADWTIPGYNSTKPAQGGIVSLNDTDTDTSVVYDDIFPSSGGAPVVNFTLANVTDVSPTNIYGIITATSITGFTVDYSTAIDTDNWKLYWQATQY